MHLKIFEWYSLNSIRSYPFVSNDTILPNNFLIDIIMYSSKSKVCLIKIHVLDNGLLRLDNNDTSYIEIDTQTYKPYTPVNILRYGHKVGTAVFGDGISDYSLFLINFAFGLEYEAKTIMILYDTISSINKLVGNVSLIGTNGIQLTKVNNDIMISAIYEKEACDPPRENCVKSLNNELPDINGDISIETSGILYSQTKTNEVIIKTKLTQEMLCVTRFEDGLKGDDGQQGISGPSGANGSCVQVVIPCCLCELCNIAELCEVCEICDMCEACDICEICNTAEGGGTSSGCSSCNTCNTCNICDFADGGCIVCDTCEVCDICETCNTME